MTVGDFILVALSVAGGIALGDVAKTFIVPAIDWLSKRSIETHKFALELRKLGYARVLDRYEACRTILAEVAADEEGIRGFVEQTQWEKMKEMIAEDDRYTPLFFLDDTKSQLERILDNSAHLLPALIIDQAIAYRTAGASVDVITRAVMAPTFRGYETPRKLMMIDRAREYAQAQLELVPKFREKLDAACRELESVLALDAPKR